MLGEGRGESWGRGAAAAARGWRGHRVILGVIWLFKVGRVCCTVLFNCLKFRYGLEEKLLEFQELLVGGFLLLFERVLKLEDGVLHLRDQLFLIRDGLLES